MLVKKYGNRRLYDTETSKYIRLDEIAERIRAGADVRVIDAESEADLTGPTLAQIIFEDRNAARLLPVPLLLQLIRMGDEPLADFLGRYVSWAFEIYTQARAGLSGLYNPFAGLRAFASSPPPPAPAPPTPEPPAPREATPPPASSVSETRDELKELRRELDELRQSLKPKKPRKPRAR